MSSAALWSEGFAELLSHNLDGAGRLRTISPTVGFARWQGRADPAAAGEFGRDLDAGLAVFGRIVPDGDGIRVPETLMDVSDNGILRDVEVRGPERNMSSLADSVAATLLSDLSRVRSLGATRLNSLGSRSPPAIREFLLGESHYRSFRMDSAELHHDRALAADSGFALAWARLGMIAAWEPNNEEEARIFRLTAGALNHGLSTRESLLVVSDSLAAALSRGAMPAGSGSTAIAASRSSDRDNTEVSGEPWATLSSTTSYCTRHHETGRKNRQPRDDRCVPGWRRVPDAVQPRMSGATLRRGERGTMADL